MSLAPAAEGVPRPSRRLIVVPLRAWRARASIQRVRRLALPSVACCTALVWGCGGAGQAPPAVSSVCPGLAANVRQLVGVRTAAVRVPGAPFSVVASRSGRWSFASLPHAIAVLSSRGFAPRLVRSIELPADVGAGQHELALTADGRYLLAAVPSGAVVIDVARAERGGAAVLGRLTSPVRALPGMAADAGPSAVVGSRDGRYVFVARGRSGGVAVFDLLAAIANGFYDSGLVGLIPVGTGPVGLAVSPSGRRLYVTSVARAPTPGATSAGTGGTLSVIDTALAEQLPRRSVLRTVAAGCEPLAVATSPNGRVVWVTTIAEHSVLGFNTSRLVRNPAHALAAVVRVGDTPVGLLSFAGGRRLLVADAGHPAVDGTRAALSVIDTARALAGLPALVGSVPAGVYPRRLALLPRRATALVTNFGSAQVEAIDLGGIP